MFRTATCPSSGELVVSIRHLVYVTLCRWPSGMQMWMELHGIPSKPANMQQAIKLIKLFDGLCFLYAVCDVICLPILWVAVVCTNPALPEKGFLKYIQYVLTCGCGCVLFIIYLFMYLFVYLLTFSMLHNKVTLHALQLNIHNTATYIYQLCTNSSWFQTFAVFWIYYVFFWVVPRRLNYICQYII